MARTKAVFGAVLAWQQCLNRVCLSRQGNGYKPEAPPILRVYQPYKEHLMSKILVTGGAGYIGSNSALAFCA
ncbi:MAG: hypothetical protein WCR47_01465 [Desulfoplanes sp.]